MSETKPMPTPWVVGESKWCGHDDCPHGHISVSIHGGPLLLPVLKVDASSPEHLEQARANAAMIVRAVNSHAELLAALKIAVATWLFPWPGGPPEKLSLYDQAQAAIKKAEATP